MVSIIKPIQPVIIVFYHGYNNYNSGFVLNKTEVNYDKDR